MDFFVTFDHINPIKINTNNIKNVEELLELINNKISFPIEELKILHGARILDISDSLLDLNIEDGPILSICRNIPANPEIEPPQHNLQEILNMLMPFFEDHPEFLE